MTLRLDRFVVGGVDRAGVPWTEASGLTPVAALGLLKAKRALRDGRVYFVYDAENEEAGDREDYLEQLVADALDEA